MVCHFKVYLKFVTTPLSEHLQLWPASSKSFWTVNNALKRPSQFWGITGWGSFSVWKFCIKRYSKRTYSFVKFRLISNINADGTLTSSEKGYKTPYKVKWFHLNVLVINNMAWAADFRNYRHEFLVMIVWLFSQLHLFYDVICRTIELHVF